MGSMHSHSLIFLLLFASGGVRGQFQLNPQNTTVLRGTDVNFNGSVTGQWEIMTWNVGGLLVLTINAETGVVASGRFSARNRSSSVTSIWEFTIGNVTRNDSGPIICRVQGSYGMRTAQLNVQEPGAVDIPGGNVSVFQDQPVEFQCVASAWFPEPTVTWTQGGVAFNSSLYNTSVQAHGDQFNSTSVLRFQAVNNTTVECLATVVALTKPTSDTVYLLVVPKPTDWTVLIAVVASIGGFALLLLLILAIIFCVKWKKKRESSYQDEMRRVSPVSGADADGQRRGEVNLGYAMDGAISVTPSDSGFSQANDSNSYEVPDGQAGNAYNNLDGPGFRKHRHVTIV